MPVAQLARAAIGTTKMHMAVRFRVSDTEVVSVFLNSFFILLFMFLFFQFIEFHHLCDILKRNTKVGLFINDSTSVRGYWLLANREGAQGYSFGVLDSFNINKSLFKASY